MNRLQLLLIGSLITMAGRSDCSEPPKLGQSVADSFAEMALRGVVREYPNKPSNVMDSAADVRSPRQMHPVFFGSFDWHSSVHGHWLLARVLGQFPDGNSADRIREVLNEQLTAEKLQKEADYFQAEHNKSFERMYGWAWLMQLVTELDGSDDADAKRWRNNLRPLEAQILRRLQDYLPKLSFPIRTGIHQDTGFALGMLIDYARATKNESLEQLLVAKAKAFYGKDQRYPVHYEPSGHDFFSSGFNEADLMRRVLPPEQFSNWLDRFLPELSEDRMGPMMVPVEVTDVTDGHLVHLAGLNLSRAWTMTGIASALKEDDPRRKRLQKSAIEHGEAGLKYVNSGHYEGEHWLATFALYYLTRN